MQFCLQFPCLKHTITPPSPNDFGLLFEREVSPRKIWVHNVAIESQDFVVADGARVGEVIHACLVVFGQHDAGGQQVVQDGVAVRDVDHAGVVGDLGHEIAGVHVV